jgi:transposase
MPLTLSKEEWNALERAQARSPKVRHWRRYQAVLLRAAGVPVAEVARDLSCSEASVSNWTAAWRTAGLVGVAQSRHTGAARRLDVTAEAALDSLVTEGDLQAHGYAAANWTAPLLRTELAKRGWPAAERTIRRTLHRLGWRWKRPKYVLGRPDPAYAEKKSRRTAGGSHDGGGREVWFGDETRRRQHCASSRRCAPRGPSGDSNRSW